MVGGCPRLSNTSEKEEGAKADTKAQAEKEAAHY
jgi:hypothetical protein